jgi:hypothetical protein
MTMTMTMTMTMATTMTTTYLYPPFTLLAEHVHRHGLCSVAGQELLLELQDMLLRSLQRLHDLGPLLNQRIDLPLSLDNHRHGEG